MIVLIVNTGRVEQRVIETTHDLSTSEGEATLGLRPGQGQRQRGGAAARRRRRLAWQSLPEEFEPDDRDLVRAVVRSLEDALVEEREERVVLAGTSNLARVGTDFPLSIGPVLEALEQHVVLLKLLGTARETSDARVGAHRRTRTRSPGCSRTSVVSTEYGSGSELVAGLGVLGPTRMDYPTTMASVRAVATYVSRILAQ